MDTRSALNPDDVAWCVDMQHAGHWSAIGVWYAPWPGRQRFDANGVDLLRRWCASRPFPAGTYRLTVLTVFGEWRTLGEATAALPASSHAVADP